MVCMEINVHGDTSICNAKKIVALLSIFKCILKRDLFNDTPPSRLSKQRPGQSTLFEKGSNLVTKRYPVQIHDGPRGLLYASKKMQCARTHTYAQTALPSRLATKRPTSKSKTKRETPVGRQPKTMACAHAHR